MAQLPTVPELQKLGYEAGLAAVGVTSADALQPAADVLPSRKSAGLADDMQFTYRNPQRSTTPTAVFGSAKSIVTGALGYFQGPRLPPDASSAEIARYSWEDHYERLAVALAPIAAALTAAGAKAQILADSNALVDRNVAWRSGIGWYGKNANIILPEHGSWVVLGAVLTDAELSDNIEPVADQCGSCSLCISGCPTGAIVAPGVVDAQRCIAWLVQSGGEIPIEYREAVGNRIYGCDECQEVCPPNRAAPVKLGLKSKAGDQIVDLKRILGFSDSEILDRYGRWYIADRNCDVIRRTALLVLGNISEPSDEEVVALLKTYLSHNNEVLRAHAVWACRRLGLRSLLRYVEEDTHPSVQAELTATVNTRFS